MFPLTRVANYENFHGSSVSKVDVEEKVSDDQSNVWETTIVQFTFFSFRWLPHVEVVVCNTLCVWLRLKTQFFIVVHDFHVCRWRYKILIQWFVVWICHVGSTQLGHNFIQTIIWCFSCRIDAECIVFRTCHVLYPAFRATFVQASSVCFKGVVCLASQVQREFFQSYGMAVMCFEEQR